MGLSVKLENDVRTIIPRKTGFANKEKHRSSDNPSRSSPKQREYWQKGQNEAVQKKKRKKKHSRGGCLRRHRILIAVKRTLKSTGVAILANMCELCAHYKCDF